MAKSNPNTFMKRDQLLVRERLCPAAEGTAAFDPIDLGGNAGVFVAECEAVVEAPPLSATQLPAGAAIAVMFEHSADGVTYKPLSTTLALASGAEGTGGAKASRVRFRMPTPVERYLRASVMAGTGVAAPETVLVFTLLF